MTKMFEVVKKADMLFGVGIARSRYDESDYIEDVSILRYWGHDELVPKIETYLFQVADNFTCEICNNAPPKMLVIFIAIATANRWGINLETVLTTAYCEKHYKERYSKNLEETRRDEA